MTGKMFSKLGISLISLVAVASFLWVGAFASEQESPDEVTIQSELWTVDKYEASKLTHKKHTEEYEIACAECHHVYKDGKNVWKEGDEVQKCDECHTCGKTGKALKEAAEEEKELSLYNAYHGKSGNCVGCHKKYNKEKETKDAPTKCGSACHAKKKKDK